MLQASALFIHGIGTQSLDFAHDAQKWLTSALAIQGVELTSESAWWAPEMDRMENRLLKACKAMGADDSPMRRLAVSVLDDALAYRKERPVFERIHDVVNMALGRLYGPWIGTVHPSTPLFVFAHSMGGLIFTDYLTRTASSGDERAPSALRRFVTFGCNIPLFALGSKFVVPAPLTQRGRWLNYWDADDFLGYPLGIMPELMGLVRDERVNVGGLLTWWNGFSHLEYWSDRSFWQKTIAPAVASAVRG